MQDKTILVTGSTGQGALPVAHLPAEPTLVLAPPRFRDVAAGHRSDAAGVTCVTSNLAAGDLTGVPTDVDHVVNLAVAKSGRWDLDLRINAEAPGLLMAHCRR